MGRQPKDNPRELYVHERNKMLPSDFWQTALPSNERAQCPWGPTPGKYRPQPHVKVNECDH